MNGKMNYRIAIQWNSTEHLKKNTVKHNMDESQKCYIKQMKPDMQNYILN